MEREQNKRQSKDNKITLFVYHGFLLMSDIVIIIRLANYFVKLVVNNCNVDELSSVLKGAFCWGWEIGVPQPFELRLSFSMKLELLNNVSVLRASNVLMR